MAGVRLLEPGRRDAHAEEPEPDHRILGDVGAVGRLDEVDLGVLGRGVPLDGSATRRGRGARLCRRLLDSLHLDARRDHGRRMRYVVLVAEDELKGVLTGGERDLRLGLPGAEMQVLEVVRNLGVERGRRRVDDQMVMAGVGAVGTRRRDAHAAQPEMDGRLGRYRVAVVEADEVDRGTRRRRRRTAGLPECRRAEGKATRMPPERIDARSLDITARSPISWTRPASQSLSSAIE